MIYAISGPVYNAFKVGNEDLQVAYDADGNVVMNAVPNGTLDSDKKVALPDIYGNGNGWTCTGLAYDSGTFLVGDIGKATPSSEGFASQIVRVSEDFTSVVETIPLYGTFSNMEDIQGITVDADGTIWFCSTSEKLIRHIGRDGSNIGTISLTAKPTGIAYSSVDDTLWVLTYASSDNIVHFNKNGDTLESFTFAYSDALDQCFLDETRNRMYITAGANYTGRNNVYVFDLGTHAQSIACTVDSYSVEGIWIGGDQMIIVNDGYYHSAYVSVNQANFYNIP